MCNYKVAQSESLWGLRANQLVAWNARRCRKAIITLQYRLTAFNARNGITIFLADGNVRRYNVLRQQWAHCIVHKHKVVIFYPGLLQTVYSVVDRLLSVLTAIENPSQFRHHKLVGIRLQHSLPTIEAHHSNAVNVGMLLESQHRVDYYRAVVNVHKLLRYVLPHPVSGTAGNYQCVIHI